MNIFEQYLDKIKEILSTLSSNGDLILPDSLNGITAEIPPSKFDSDISTNVAMVLSNINNKSPSDLASILAEKIKKEEIETYLDMETLDKQNAEIIFRNFYNNFSLSFY